MKSEHTFLSHLSAPIVWCSIGLPKDAMHLQQTLIFFCLFRTLGRRVVRCVRVWSNYTDSYLIKPMRAKFVLA